MLSDRTPVPAGTPRICDLIRLRPGNVLGIDPHVWLLVVDEVRHLPGTFEVWMQEDRPGYLDWAGAVTAADVADIIPAELDEDTEPS